MKHKPHRDQPRRTPSTRTPPSPTRTDPLSDDRFQMLMRAAGSFFAAAENDTVAERAAVIEDIRRTMAEYGLTVDDLLEGDPPPSA
ncbi:MAG: hypothetical protein R3E94_12765 [Burkholderiaceae bacterium]